VLSEKSQIFNSKRVDYSIEHTKVSLKKGSTTFGGKRIFATPALTLTLNSNPNTNPNSDPNPKAPLCFRTDEMTSFFDQVYQYLKKGILKRNLLLNDLYRSN